jgi:hypothetical protein
MAAATLVYAAAWAVAGRARRSERAERAEERAEDQAEQAEHTRKSGATPVR